MVKYPSSKATSIFSNFIRYNIHKNEKEVIFIILEYEKIEQEYISTDLSYAELAKKHNVPRHLISKYAKENDWVNKRKLFSGSQQYSLLDVSRLARSSDALDCIIENAFCDLSEQRNDKKEFDTKTLKDLTSTLKEAINIKQNIFMLPMITEQKQLELESRKNPTVITENEIRVILEDDTDKYCN